MAKPIRIIVHHTAIPGDPQLPGVNEYHKSLSFPKSSLGWHAGYTYFIEKSGQVIQTRTDTEMQAHTKGLNEDSIGICLAANLDYERPTNEQLISLKNLINRKMAEYGILPDKIAGHRTFRQTSCPGGRFPESEFKALFQPDLSYYKSLLETLKDLLLKLKTRNFGSNSVSCINENSRL